MRPTTAPLPQLWGVLYAGPNANGERKACSNCMFFSQGSSPASVLLGAQKTNCRVLPVNVQPTQVCGYHVPAGEKADPDLAGLEDAPGGTSCDTCTYYEPGASVCLAVEGENGGPAPVEPMGCCARWEETDAVVGQESEYR